MKMARNHDKKKFQFFGIWEGRKVGLVHSSVLAVDHNYQRHLDKKSVEQKADPATFDRKALRGLVVAYRDDGKYYILDGQTRHEMMQQKQVSSLLENPQWVLCEVHDDLTRKEEATLFPKLNNFKNVTPTAKFKANLAAGGEREKAIEGILARHNLVIRFRGRPRLNDQRTPITSLGTLERIWADRGKENLEDTIYVLTKAFQRPNGIVQPAAISQQWLKAVSHYLFENSTADCETLINALDGFIAEEVYKNAMKDMGMRSDPWRQLSEWIGKRIASQHRNKRRQAA